MSQRPIELPDDHAIAGDRDGRNDRDSSSLNEQPRPRELVERFAMRPVFLTVAVAAATAVAAPLFVQAQGVPQTVQLTKVDVIKVATGFRASKVIGSSVVNDAGETVGRVDDVIIAEEGKAPFVVLAVGGFLGIGDKLVVLPYQQLKTMDRKIVMPGATKEALKDLPTFKYAPD
jgi:sporulation protein YlmC with PRC-barrel domain